MDRSLALQSPMGMSIQQWVQRKSQYQSKAVVWDHSDFSVLTIFPMMLSLACQEWGIALEWGAHKVLLRKTSLEPLPVRGCLSKPWRASFSLKASNKYVVPAKQSALIALTP